ncbi:MAG: DUF6951 family protein [Candidatus Woesearchaeota archaeon]
MTKVKLDSGICGFKTEIKVTLQKDFKVKVVLNSECPHISGSTEVTSQEKELLNLIFNYLNYIVLNNSY